MGLSNISHVCLMFIITSLSYVIGGGIAYLYLTYIKRNISCKHYKDCYISIGFYMYILTMLSFIIATILKDVFA